MSVSGKIGAMFGLKQLPAYRSVATALLSGSLLVAGVVLLYAAVAAWGFGYRYSPLAMLLDGLLLLPLTTSLMLVARWRWTVVACTFALGFFGLLAHAIKSDQLGVPLMAADIGPLWQLLNILPGWRRLLAWVLIVVVLSCVLGSLWPRRGGVRWLLPLPLIVLGWSFAGGALQNSGVVSALDPREVGGIAFLAGEIGGSLRNSASGPDRAEVITALAALPAARPSEQLVARRNVYMVLLETVWDPLQLHGYQFSRDPWDERFRRLWEMGGRSHILSPAFGGATANAEFEALCGMPASSNRVLFETGVSRPLNCLPRLMRDSGYTTMASHPYKSNFWARETAYRYAGFESYFPIDAYQLDDMDGMFLNDHSSYQQLLERKKMASTPLFSYAVSLSSHYPFDRDKSARPDVLSVTPDDGLLGAYANALAWSTKAFMDYVDQVLVDDPTALVVAFGDHAPVLGTQPNPYVQAGLRGGENGEDLVALAKAPLLVIDGENGPVALGDLALYELPNSLLKLIQPGVRLHAGIFDEVPGKARPFLGRMLRYVNSDQTNSGNGGWEACNQSIGQCAENREAFNNMRIVRKDLAEGGQFSLALTGQVAPTATIMQISRPFPSCALSVQAWGPEGTTEGIPFNVQGQGRSAFWFKTDEARGELKVEVGGEVTDLLVAGKAASASFQDPEFLKKPGRYPVRAFCAGVPAWEIGHFVVTKATSVKDVQSANNDNHTDICHISVQQWGPQSTPSGVKFNVQPDGSVAFWLTVEAAGGTPELKIGEQKAPLFLAGNKASASFLDPVFPARPGSHPVSVQCPGQPSISIGEFMVIATESEVKAAEPPQAVCDVQVSSWGPQSSTVGVPFNQQGSDGSALWINTPQARLIKAVEIGSERQVVDAAEGTVSSLFSTPDFLTRPGSYPVRVICHNDKASAEIGRFNVL